MIENNTRQVLTKRKLCSLHSAYTLENTAFKPKSSIRDRGITIKIIESVIYQEHVLDIGNYEAHFG